MAVIKQGGSNPYQGKVMTTMGYREPRPPLCMKCGGRKPGLYTVDGNGQQVCPDCASPADREILVGKCDPDKCACGEKTDGEPDPAA